MNFFKNMKIFKNTSKLSRKLLFPIISSVVLSILIVAGIVLSICSIRTNSLSNDYINVLSKDYANQVESKLSLTLNTAQTLATDIGSVMNQQGTTRDDILKMVKSVILKHDELVGIGVGFDPNAFDGKDIENIGQKHSDSNGRFVPYTFKTGSDVDYTILYGYDDPGPDGSWYSVPKSTNKTYVTAPYWYEIGSEKYLIVTCVAPILDNNGNFIGMVGFDTLLDSLNNIFSEAKIYKSGYLMFIAPDGTIAYHPNTQLESTSIYDSFPSKITDVADKVYDTGETVQISENAMIKTKMCKDIFIPIEVGESGGKWLVVSSTPLREIHQTIFISFLATIISGLLIIVLINYILIKFVKKMIISPIIEINNSATMLAKGNLNIDVSHESDDEMGMLSQNLQSTGQLLATYVNNISITLDHMAHKDFSDNIEMEYIGDFAPIKSSMHQIQNQLNKVLSNIKNISIGVAGGAEQVSSGAQILSQGTAEQAMSIEELKCIIDDILEQINNNSQSAHKAQEAVEIAGSKLLSSNEQMNELTKAISQISDSSEEIRKIIQTIEGISLQTNMLALNASIEAARAGEAGKGFAVVANEVRELANRSSEASKGTASLIENSLSSVNNGIKIAKETAASLLLVVDKAQQVIVQVDQIVDASKEQSLSVANITKGMQEISSVVQTNSTTADESASASEDLSSQAKVLKGLVESFTLKDTN